ncbi:MAG TPA: ribonuclease P protein component [Gemmatales bacterium]|nr:ribonuclease P protein component [Gemmatales bacterium]HMP59833.1 ribonuclease P protein component [Gemmatales bacterium]
MTHAPEPEPRRPGDQRLRHEERLRGKRVFDAIFADRCSVRDDRLVAYGRRNGLNVTRLGVAVGRRFGSAVHRNRRKRLLREAFRQCKTRLPVGLDLVLLPATAEELEWSDLVARLPALVSRLARRLEARAQP